MSEALFFHPAVIAVVRARLVLRGIRGKADFEDAIGEVVLACIEYVRRTGRPPADVEEAKAIARVVADRHGIDEARKRVDRGKQNIPDTGDADEHAHEAPRSLDPVDKERMLQTVRQVLSDEQIEALSDVGAGVTQAQLAAERGVARPAMRKRVQTSRGKAAGALGAKGYWVAGGFAALLAGSAAVSAVAFREPNVAHPRQGGPEEQAAEQRNLAADACNQRRWDECEKALDRAARLDPQSDRRAEVKALRAAIAAGRLATGAGDGAGKR